MTPEIIFIVGPQGCGKGTQGKKLAEQLGFFFWGMGKILREIAAEKSALSEKVIAIDKGALLPDEVIFEVVMQRLPFLIHEKGIVFDGIPRRIEQGHFLLQYLRASGRKEMATVLIDLPREESVKRLLERAKKENRVDDTPDAIEMRFHYYDQAIKPTIEYLEHETKFVKVNGEQPIDKVFADIERELGLG